MPSKVETAKRRHDKSKRRIEVLEDILKDLRKELERRRRALQNELEKEQRKVNGRLRGERGVPMRRRGSESS